MLGPGDEDFGGTGTGVVVGAEAHAVSAGVEDGEEVAGFGGGEDAVAGEEVAGFADRAYDVDRLAAGGLLDWKDLVVSLIESGADEIVHAGVGDDEGLGFVVAAGAVFLDVEDGGEEHAGLSYEEAAGLEEEMKIETAGSGEDLRRVGGDGGGGVEGGGGVLDAEAAAGVDVGKRNAVLLELADERGDAGKGFAEGIDGADLRADVDRDAGGNKPLRSGRFTIEGAGEGDVDAELMGGEAGGDVGVCLGEDVGVDAEGEAGGTFEGQGAGGEKIELGDGFDVEEEDAGGEGGVDFVDLLAYSGEDGFRDGFARGSLDAGEFASGDDVEAGAGLREELEDGEGGVGFYGVADGVGDLGEGLLEEGEAAEDVGLGVDVERGAVLGREFG